MIKINRKYLKTYDWYIFTILILISALGVLTIYSATRPILTNIQPDYYFKQIVWILIGIIGLVSIAIYDYIWLKKTAYYLYIFGLILLFLVLILGKKGLGAQRWIEFGFFTFQPSELFKIIHIIAYSRYLSGIKDKLTKTSFIIASIVFAIVPFALIIKQPHLGTSLIVLSQFFFLSLAKGIERRFLVTMVIIASIALPISGGTLWSGLKDYQKNRVSAFLNPAADPKGIGYQIEQSKITIGSGVVFGIGYLKGTQGPLKFLPEKHTDFIFSVFAEEWGFLGSVIILSMYLLLFMRGIDTAVRAKDDYGKFLALGITFMLYAYFVINIGMVLGMMPVVGVPIPFMSYGGTSIITNYITIGILINIRMRRLILYK
ncbi:cell wall shape-determining protein [Candidatus Magnetoovum chiemensis]|nr:cell wall shape-determining protein [Candidatus Magnetoovum chiemensis]